MACALAGFTCEKFLLRKKARLNRSHIAQQASSSTTDKAACSNASVTLPDALRGRSSIFDQFDSGQSPSHDGFLPRLGTYHTNIWLTVCNHDLEYQPATTPLLSMCRSQPVPVEAYTFLLMRSGCRRSEAYHLSTTVWSITVQNTVNLENADQEALASRFLTFEFKLSERSEQKMYAFVNKDGQMQKEGQKDDQGRKGILYRVAGDQVMDLRDISLLIWPHLRPQLA